MSLLIILMSSCSVTRNLAPGEYLLGRNVIKTDKSVKRKDRISTTDFERYVVQSPNRRILGMNLPIFIWAQANPNKDNWYNNLLRRIGEEPVILDSLNVERSAINLKTYMNASGYLSSESSYEIEAKKKKAKVIYTVKQNQPYTIGTISYDYQDKFIQEVIRQDSASTLLHSGDIFDTQVLDQERQRITTYLKNNGYYDFSLNNISYLADSLGGNNVIDITLIIKQSIAGYDSKGEAILENNQISRLSNIYILPAYNPNTNLNNRGLRSETLDTVSYRGLKILYDKELNVREGVLRDLVDIYPNSIYNSDMVSKTYNSIIRNNYFNSANILFRQDTNLVNQTISYIGANDKVESTSENYLNCTILATPALRQNYKIELEASVASNFYALTATAGYQNRNLFKGMEIFDISVSGGYEFLRSETTESGSFEIGGATSIALPRFLFPYMPIYDKLQNTYTKFEISYNMQERIYYNRTLSNATWSYSWNNNRYSSYTIRPIDVSLVKMSYIDQNFWNDLENPYLQNSYTSQLIAGISSYYVYNNQGKNPMNNSILVRASLETTGNSIYGFSKLFSSYSPGEDFYDLFSIRFAQYVRGEASVSHKIVLSQEVNLVYRALAGAGLSYGNSESIPFDRLFYSGGSNSMRGWVARTLGPGNETVADSNYPNQLGNMKLEANLEMRFPVWGVLKGALFFDLGNIWFLRESDSTPEGVFKFNSFYKQLGLNTGLGARLDFDFFILRLDWGVKLHDPNESVGNRWVISNKFNLDNTSFNFGVGYPF